MNVSAATTSPAEIGDQMNNSEFHGSSLGHKSFLTSANTITQVTGVRRAGAWRGYVIGRLFHVDAFVRLHPVSALQQDMVQQVGVVLLLRLPSRECSSCCLKFVELYYILQLPIKRIGSSR
ncbi:hypothetical protein O6H91_23G070400 [Diphasiastrum complanatum]|uniref:Uncharacterized protein n=1 Tax=Diphasiastrum complanatum TaxID=34168 RepID=A0ACC2ABX9_DIPCM|nr:hypothetical protein O6H91_23G070400 [Diphasiastrum complanatum]